MDVPVLAELKRRRVFRAVITYAVAAFAVLQIIEPIMHGLHWPDVVLSYVVVALAVGFPVVVALAWIFDLREGRVERTAPSSSTPQMSRVAPVLAAIAALGAIPALLYLLVLRSDRPKPQAAAQPAPAIAVLPFVNIGAGKQNEYFSDGITEELINALANIEGLRVVSRTAVFSLRGKSASIQQIGAELNVQTILEGSVQREGNALRVSAQLINVADGFHLWSKTYDRELKSVFAVEDEIARAIADALKRKLVRVSPATANENAHDLYLRGRYFWNKRSAEAVRTATGYFERAIAEDPGYALAYAGLADCLALSGEYQVIAPNEMIPRARAAAERALQLDPGLAEAHASLGLVARLAFDPETSMREYRAALALKPEYAMARKWYADELVILGRLDEARTELERAARDDPTSPIINFTVAEMRLYDRDFDGAAAAIRKVLELDPAFPPAHLALIHLDVVQHKYAQALAEIDRLPHRPNELRVLRAHVLLLAGKREQALALVREAQRRAADEPVSPVMLAGFWASAGDKDKAFPLLQKACTARDTGMLMLKVEPSFAYLRSDPRYQELLRCAHLD